MHRHTPISSFFFFNDTATTEIYTFPYTTLFRSLPGSRQGARAAGVSLTRRDSSANSPTLRPRLDRKSTRLNSSHLVISYAVFCLKKKKTIFFSDEDPTAHAVVTCVHTQLSYLSE